jgi:NIMA (never in mitosis gene a)-related kinase
LRFLFALVSNRRFFKRMFPPDLFAKFIDVGHYKYDLALYRPLAKVVGQLTPRGLAKLTSGIQETNVTLAPTKRIRNYNIFETLG